MANRIRVSYFLPITHANDQIAHLRTLDYLRSPRPSAEAHLSVTGFTLSSVDPPAFRGVYWSDERRVWLEDSISILFVDLPTSEAVRERAAAMKTTIAQFYAEEGSAQEEMWCTLEGIEAV